MELRGLKSGMVLDNSQITKIFLCSSQGGMRRSLRTGSLVLISDQTKVYRDRWENDVFLYTGMGLTGNQDFHYMQNKTLYESRTNGVSVYLFEVFSPREYTYVGNVELAANPYMEQQGDQNNNSRLVCIFPLKVKANE